MTQNLQKEMSHAIINPNNLTGPQECYIITKTPKYNFDAWGFVHQNTSQL